MDNDPVEEKSLDQEGGDWDIAQEIQKRKAEAENTKVAQDLLVKVQEQIEHQKMLDRVESDSVGVGEHGRMEQILLMVGAGILIFALPFLQYGSSIILTLFAVIICLAAGVTSSRKSYSPGLNLLVSVIGLICFEYSAISQFHFFGATGLFLLDQALAFDFLLAAYFSMVTYRHEVLEKE
jgi:hypothetical protein